MKDKDELPKPNPIFQPTRETHPDMHPAILAILEWAPRMAEDIKKKTGKIGC